MEINVTMIPVAMLEQAIILAADGSADAAIVRGDCQSLGGCSLRYTGEAVMLIQMGRLFAHKANH